MARIFRLSDLGFHVVIEDDAELRVLHTETGQKYMRPEEAETTEKARIQSEKARSNPKKHA